MNERLRDTGIQIFSTCPASYDDAGPDYLEQVARVARWSENAGCTGLLIYTDNRSVDPWLVAQTIAASTDSLCPLVAVQPIYMHPYSVAKMVSSLSNMYRRRVFLNMVAGGFKNDLLALNDTTPHDRRYERLVEYTTIVKELLDGSTVSFSGAFYTVDKLKMAPTLAPQLAPGVFLSGSSDAGREAAKLLGATAIEYPKPAGEDEALRDPVMNHGVRIGIIARAEAAEAWALAHARFPEDRKGQLTHELAMKVSDSVWHRQLAEMAEAEAEAGADSRDPYWLVPFKNYKTFCPYLVGSYERVAGELGRYVAKGFETFILDVPGSLEDLDHVARTFELALQPREVPR